MAATAYLPDTNILLCFFQPGGPYDELVASAVERLVEEGTTLFYTPQNATEFWNACTRRQQPNGLGPETRAGHRDPAKRLAGNKALPREVLKTYRSS